MPIEEELFFISRAAQLLGMHPQTLRKYERLGLVQPARTVGSTRLYAREELDRLRLIKRLVDEVGLNLAGVQHMLSIVEIVQRIRPLVCEASLARPDDAERRQLALARELERLSDLLGL